MTWTHLSNLLYTSVLVCILLQKGGVFAAWGLTLHRSNPKPFRGSTVGSYLAWLVLPQALRHGSHRAMVFLMPRLELVHRGLRFWMADSPPKMMFSLLNGAFGIENEQPQEVLGLIQGWTVEHILVVTYIITLNVSWFPSKRMYNGPKFHHWLNKNVNRCQAWWWPRLVSSLWHGNMRPVPSQSKHQDRLVKLARSRWPSMMGW